MKNILVPTDFSECADNAVEVAIEIATRTQARLHFLHFTAIPIDWVNLIDHQEKMYPDVTRRIKQRQEDLNQLVSKAESKGLSCQTYIGYNESYANIIRYSEDNEIDLVVMGSHGASGLKEFFLGSNAQKVIRLSDAPVLIVKEKTNHFDFDRMVIVSDFLRTPDYEFKDAVPTTVDHLKSLAGILDLPVQFLFVNTRSNFISSKSIKQRIGYYENLFGKDAKEPEVINAETIEEGLLDYMDENPRTLFAMMTHGYKGISRLMNGSVVETVANHVDSPLISVKMF
jgi:nucleotide-binding universal stress UspA family protein